MFDHIRRCVGTSTRMLVLFSVGACAAIPLTPRPLTASTLSPSDIIQLSVRRPDGTPTTVVIEMVMTDPSADPAQAIQARQEIAARFPGAVVENPAGEHQVPAAVFGWADARVEWAYNLANRPPGLEGDYEAVTAAADTWNNAGAAWEFVARGITDATLGACGGAQAGLDGQNTIGWATQPPGVGAITCTWYSGSPGVAAEFDLAIDPGWNWSTHAPAHVDLQSVATHELGHALGLPHSDEPASVMFASYHEGDVRRELDPIDVQAVTALYGTAAGGGAPAPEIAGATIVTWEGGDGAPVTALVENNNQLVAIYGYDPTRTSWQRYLPGLPGYLASLRSLEHGVRYWVVVQGLP